MESKEMIKLCPHCGMDLAIRNPSGKCDHLYYADYCKVCQENKEPKADEVDMIDNQIKLILMLLMDNIVRLNNPKTAEDYGKTVNLIRYTESLNTIYKRKYFQEAIDHFMNRLQHVLFWLCEDQDADHGVNWCATLKDIGEITEALKKEAGE